MMGKVKFGVIVFPGSNCDHDAHYASGQLAGQDSRLIWHKEGSLGDVDVVIVPGGFSYGDYLRCGAIARFSPIMKDVVRFAGNDGLVVGICNGFQILTEAGLLPGVLLRNESLLFVCRNVGIRTENVSTRFTGACKKGEVLKIPIAHGDGNYFAEADTIEKLEEHDQVVFRYCDESGQVTKESNPNGSVNNIAGIVNEEGNVLGMMPHPERASDELLGLTDGKKIFESIINSYVSSAKQFAAV
ncbi:MAG: phosphoribosylformylglycinamidine synthase subunit PurQ [Bacteroidota bacterium]